VGWEPLMSMRALRGGEMRGCEIPADEPPRIRGKRKLQIFRWGSVYMIQLFTEFFKRLRS